MVFIEHAVDGRVVTVTINRPEKRNALNAALVQELTRTLADLASDERLRVVVLCGAGDVFSAGADLEALERLRTASFEENLADSTLLATLFITMRSVPYVIVAKVHGHAIAGGCGLVVACDMATASSTAKFGFTEVRIGFVPALVSVLLEGSINHTHRRELFLSGRLVTAEEAAAVGLVHRVVPPGALDDDVHKLVTNIARNTSRQAIAGTKSMLLGSEVDFRARMSQAAKLNALARSEAECKAGVLAFLNRQDPPWTRSWDQDHTDRA